MLPGADEWARYPYIMGKLQASNKTGWNLKFPGNACQNEFSDGNSGEQELRLSASGVPKFATFRTEPEVISPAGEADIVVTIDTSQIPSGKGSSFTFPIIIEGIDGPQSDRTLNIRVNRIE